MLIDNNGNKPYQIEITEQTWKETKQVIINGINKKLVAARRLIVNDKEVAAGLYIYAVEEFGKLLLLLETKLENNIRKIKYRNEFLNHNVKFSKALDYLEAHNYNKCIVLNDEGGFSAESFSWRGFTIGLLPKTEARLSIFYTDFIYN